MRLQYTDRFQRAYNDLEDDEVEQVKKALRNREARRDGRASCSFV